MPDVPDETEAAWVRRFSGITHAQAETLMADTRDKRRARLDATITISLKGINLGLQYQFQLAKDLRAELEASQRDRKALADYGLLHDGKAGQHWIYAAAGRLAAGDLEADVLADFGYTKGRGGRYARERSQLRKALAEARELICNSAPLAWVNNPDYADDAQQWEKRAEAFLKRTEPTDD